MLRHTKWTGSKKQRQALQQVPWPILPLAHQKQQSVKGNWGRRCSGDPGAGDLRPEIENVGRSAQIPSSGFTGSACAHMTANRSRGGSKEGLALALGVILTEPCTARCVSAPRVRWGHTPAPLAPRSCTRPGRERRGRPSARRAVRSRPHGASRRGPRGHCRHMGLAGFSSQTAATRGKES